MIEEYLERSIYVLQRKVEGEWTNCLWTSNERLAEKWSKGDNKRFIEIGMELRK